MFSSTHLAWMFLCTYRTYGRLVVSCRVFPLEIENELPEGEVQDANRHVA